MAIPLPTTFGKKSLTAYLLAKILIWSGELTQPTEGGRVSFVIFHWCHYMQFPLKSLVVVVIETVRKSL